MKKLDRRRRSVTPLLVAALALACGGGDSPTIVTEEPRPSPAAPPANPAGSASPHDCSVYRAVFEQEPLFASADRTFVVSRQTRVGRMALTDPQNDTWDELWALVRKALPDLEDATVASYLERNRESVDLPACQVFAEPVRMIDDAEIDEIFPGGGGWDEFYGRYPGSAGQVEFSRAGFGDDGRQAFVYAALTSHWRSGEGLFLLFEKAGDGWMLIGQAGAWIA